MKNKFLLLPATIFFLLAFGAGCLKSPSAVTNQNTNTNQNNTNQNPIEKNITVENPGSGETVGFPFLIKGQARVFENTFNVRVKDSAGSLLYEDIIMSNAQDAGLFGAYEKKIDYFLKRPVSSDLTLEVFDYSAKDGSVQDLVTVPIKINLGQTQTVKLFFNNNNLDPQISCNKVFSTTRIIPPQQTIGNAALNLLLKGPSADEKNSGFYTSINPGVTLKKLTISNGVARADFDEQLESQVGGSCRVSAIRAEITQTLKQFSTVKSVIISINGRTEDILQP
ncbi:MAG: Gmad2 immunoglobulin-like domain-containing protein [Patescibacteria group bacterium]